MVRLSIAVLAVFVSASLSAQGPQPAATAFERLKAMEGEWVDVTGAFGAKGAVVATYKITGAGHTVVETFPIWSNGKPDHLGPMHLRRKK